MAGFAGGLVGLGVAIGLVGGLLGLGCVVTGGLGWVMGLLGVAVVVPLISYSICVAVSLGLSAFKASLTRFFACTLPFLA